ncbi:MAG TPA: cbb3-type cytochrome c oxidase subunit I, partial [Nocardioidaceae bacterium]|nr:cbb3-type cytochrome c oxidase subunit I [Nocardioidaceae bacterium]
MTATITPEAEATSPEPGRRPLGKIIVRWLTTTDHKVIGHLYLITSFAFFLFAGVMAMLMRAELAEPGGQIVGEETYNQLFTMHGTIMLLLFATPLFVGFANEIMPLQIGAPDVAFPRLNMLSYWLFLFGGIIASIAFIMPGGAASFGWTAYAPLSDAVNSPGVGGDLWIMGLWMAGLGTILGGVNFVTTIFTMRAPGMTMFRMPIFTWNTLVTSLLVLMAFPILAGALLMLEADRRLGAHVFDPANGGAILWQHLFWFFGHPEVYIIFLPAAGLVTMMIYTLARTPLVGYRAIVLALLATGFFGFAVWAHHMLTAGLGMLEMMLISAASFAVSVPAAIQIFSWLATLWQGRLRITGAALFLLGFLFIFVLGGLTGVMVAVLPFNWQVHDTYFIVAHLHYVLIGGMVFP